MIKTIAKPADKKDAASAKSTPLIMENTPPNEFEFCI